ncbi:MAG: poly-beta-1,6 N-acetyl-D-glucosamine export porin PgaA, partial [Gammaproteobacteria bacterium]|nr:poly-beta-1,6 N-acetyl-D-glucosamine export porin PgaA [Gammaproteobacteria bacterium]
PWRTVRLQLAYDRIGALAVRGRSSDVVAAFDALRAEGVEPPYYVLSDAAGAWQQLRRSDLSVPLYEAALQDAGGRLPMPSDTHVGLVYAYLDTARFEDADRLLVRLEQATPPTVRRSPERLRPNPEYSQVRNLRALYQLYTDDAAAAEHSFDALVASSPLNAGFRTGQAETARLRRHPDAALARYQETLTDHPDDVPARAGYASTLLETGHLREGRELADALRVEAPESIAVRNAGQQRDAVFAPRLDIDAEAGEDGGALANHEWRIDSRLTSGWWQDRWRMFYRQVVARGDTNIGDVRYVRGGLGMQWQSERWLLTGELHQANQGPYRTGVALAASWRASDAWRFAAEFDSDSIETPYKARRSGVGAHSLGASATWVANESRSVEARWQRMDFSDGNLRDAFGVDWNERLVTTPRFQLDGTLGAETARSDRQDVAYFSPSSESALQLGLAARYLTWKRDDRRWVQVVQVSGGSYRQAGFGGGPLWSVRYAHEWDVGPALRLRYGLGISGHPYDGVREQRKFVFLNLSVPLK